MDVRADMIFPHVLLYVRGLRKWVAMRTLKSAGRNVDLRPGITIVGGQHVTIGNNVALRAGTQIHATAPVIIEDDVLIAPDVFMTTNAHTFSDPKLPIRVQGGTSAPITIRSGAWIARGATILPGVTIGRNAVVAAGAVVTRDVPDHHVVGGVPARYIKTIE